MYCNIPTHITYVITYRHVLELGSGVGLVGMAMCRTCTPTSYCFTDCHPQVLSLLSSNIHLNSSGIITYVDLVCCSMLCMLCGCTDDGCGCEVSVREMDWSANADTILSSYSRPLDCIVTTGPFTYSCSTCAHFTFPCSLLNPWWYMVYRKHAMG